MRDLFRRLEHPLMNGAGCVKDLTGVERLARSAVSAVVLGSITVSPREGNSGTTYSKHEGFSLNALGLPNPGIVEIEAQLEKMRVVCHEHGKPLIVSVVGFSSVELELLVNTCAAHGVDGVELNFSCPNVQSEHSIWSFDPPSMRSALIDVLAIVGRKSADIAVGAKLSPFSDPDQLHLAAEALRDAHYVVSSNTFPNACVPHGLATSGSDGFGGLSGPALRPIALGQVRRLRDALPWTVELVGVGGVTCQQDIDDYVGAGAAAVQATTAYYNAGEDPMVFSDILSR